MPMAMEDEVGDVRVGRGGEREDQTREFLNGDKEAQVLSRACKAWVLPCHISCLYQYLSSLYGNKGALNGKIMAQSFLSSQDCRVPYKYLVKVQQKILQILKENLKYVRMEIMN